MRKGNYMIKLETERLILRNFIVTDIDDFYEYMRLESTAKYEDFEPLTYKECISSIERRIPLDNVMAVILKDSGKMIGDVIFSEGGDKGTYEIGYDFNENFWNKGYATEACIAMLNHIFNKVGGRRVYAECNDDNFSSIKLLERIGMRREGHFIEDVTFKNDSYGNPIYVNSYLYAILKRE
jgi:ribosomal-protein-alanine N-acetyltransferase